MGGNVSSKKKKEKKMYKSYSMELGGRTLTVDVGRVAKQANGAALMHYGDTMVLSTATASEKPREGIDFFPLSVEFEEKMYAVGKIPGGFNKREGKASENAILTARVIDRPMRPLFPKDYRNDCTLNNLVLSVDPECRPELVAMLGSAIATSISDIPFDGPCATTQIGMIDGEFIVNPSQEQWKSGDLNLTVASTKEKVIMIEAGANEVFTVPCGMKKSRPGVLLRVLCKPEAKEEMVGLLFKHTTTIGIRELLYSRYTLDRRIETVDTPFGPVRKKISSGYGVTREKFEYEDLARIAKENDLSISEVRDKLSGKA